MCVKVVRRDEEVAGHERGEQGEGARERGRRETREKGLRREKDG